MGIDSLDILGDGSERKALWPLQTGKKSIASNKAEVSFSFKRGYSSDRGKELSIGTGKCGAGKSREAGR